MRIVTFVSPQGVGFKVGLACRCWRRAEYVLSNCSAMVPYAVIRTHGGLRKKPLGFKRPFLHISSVFPPPCELSHITYFLGPFLGGPLFKSGHLCMTRYHSPLTTHRTGRKAESPPEGMCRVSGDCKGVSSSDHACNLRS